MFDIVCHKLAIWFWNLFNEHVLQSITAQLWRLFCCQGLPDSGCVLQSGRHVHMTSVRCYPSRTRFRTLRIFLHTSSMTVSQHAWKASTPRGVQFDSFSRSQEPPPKQELHEWSPRSLFSHRWRVPGTSSLRNQLASVKKTYFVPHFVAGEHGGATLRIYGAAAWPRGSTYRV